MIHATTRQDIDLDQDGVALLDLTRDNCQFCDMLAPVLEDVAYELPFVNVVTANTTHIDGLAEEFDVHAFPTMLVLKDGKKVDTLIGFQPGPVIADALGKHLY